MSVYGGMMYSSLNVSVYDGMMPSRMSVCQCMMA